MSPSAAVVTMGEWAGFWFLVFFFSIDGCLGLELMKDGISFLVSWDIGAKCRKIKLIYCKEVYF